MNHTYQIKKARMVMTELEALELLQRHNRWRRGDDSVEMEDPRALGNAIDVACRVLAEHIEHEKKKDMRQLPESSFLYARKVYTSD